MAADPLGEVPRPSHRSASSASRLTAILAALLALAIGLLGVAASPPAPASPSPAISAEAEAEFADDYEEEEWELEIEEEEAEEELEAGGADGPSILPPECVVRSVDPSVVAVPAGNRLQLTLRYTAEAPTKVGVEYWLKGGKGSLQLGSAKRQLSKRGVLHLSRHLDEDELAKVRAARTFMLRLDAPAADSYCKPLLVFRLAAKRQQGARTTWSERPRNRG